MRMLFCGSPVAGHLLPLVPLLRAARRRGHPVAVLSGAGAARILPGCAVSEVGPSMAEAVHNARYPLAPGGEPVPDAAEAFGGARIDGLGEDLIRAARAFGPDVVVRESADAVGPLVAAALGVPVVQHRITGPMLNGLYAAIAARAELEHARCGVRRAAEVAVLDPYPDVLLDPAERDRPAGWLAIRPEPHQPDDEPRPVPTVPAPVAALTLTTSVDDTETVPALAASVAAAGVSVLVTADRVDVPDDLRDRVHAVGFVPLADLLAAADVVICAGGTGTVLAALARGVPLVVRPRHADHPWNARRVADRGAGVVIEDPGEAGAAVTRGLADPGFRAAARRVAAAIAGLDDADRVLDHLAARLGTR